MWHDEPADRPGQDPQAYLPFAQWEDRFRERIAHYQELLLVFPGSAYLANELANYQRWFREHLLLRTTAAITDDEPPF
ncbi:MAG: hypothetical protein ROZ37_15810 [Aromatoleum sp.]|jgi:hypothetical protein|uniref:hypothetical protein n=1 Tax=Aromatoleum sp. TaxID=2307007 RepID=UPI002894D23C|nr:hypothetical protein [Aromatoleum sp.]MDT3671782.1 hypothetical protein [Aromatoleum sp.]